MARPYRTIAVERRGDVFCARLRQLQLDEPEVNEFGEELDRLIAEDGCRRLVLSLGPETLNLIYSVFMGKLLMLRRRLLAEGGALKLCEVSPHVRGVFEALQLDKYFDFYPDQPAAVAAFAVQDPSKEEPH